MSNKANKMEDFDDDLDDIFGDDDLDDMFDETPKSNVKTKAKKPQSDTMVIKGGSTPNKRKGIGGDDKIVIKSTTSGTTGDQKKVAKATMKIQDQKVKVANVEQAANKTAEVEEDRIENVLPDSDLDTDSESTQADVPVETGTEDQSAYDMLNDPEMKDIVIGFCDEALGLFNELEDVLCEAEDDVENPKHFEDYGQIIDRVMGAAKTVGADHIATYCELGKIIGYKASQTSETALLEVVVAVLFDSNDLLKKMVTQLKAGNRDLTSGLNTKAFGTRLHWLSEKFKNIDRASCSIDTKKDLGQGDIDSLLNSLGL